MSASTEPLASAAPTTESIYTGIVPVVLKHADREDRATTLTVALAYGVAQPRNATPSKLELRDPHLIFECFWTFRTFWMLSGIFERFQTFSNFSECCIWSQKSTKRLR